MVRILIVDDEMFQRILIRETLAIDLSLQFMEAENGTDALRMIEQTPPDLVILDIMMPRMDGFEVCKIIKANPELRGVPVILVTALGQLQDKVKGLDSGADDFINKPFEESELQARVRSALRIKALHDQLQDVMNMRDNLVRMVMHDMGNHTAIISSALSLYERLDPASEQAIQLVTDAYEASIGLGDMISDALDVSSSETRAMPIRRHPTDFVLLARSTCELYRGAAMETNVIIDLQVEAHFDPMINIDSGLIRRVIGNLLTNALKHAPGDSCVVMRICNDSIPGNVRLSVTDNGPGIPLDEQVIIFNKYELAKKYVDRRERPGRGIGLTFSKMAVEAHQGSIGVRSNPGEGSTFTISLPRS